MPSLFYYLRRAGEQPFRETLNQARSLASDRIGAVLQPAFDSLFGKDLSSTELLRRSGIATISDLTNRLKTRDWPHIPLSMPDAVQAAEGLLGTRMDWHTDPKSGYEWDVRLHHKKLPVAPGPGIDIKAPWELSRCHDLVTLGLAFRETTDERFSSEVVARVLDWIARNPPRKGVNWISPMEAGIRAVNWCWAVSLIRSSPAVDDRFVCKFLQSLDAHAGFIRANLEVREAWIQTRQSRLNSNHYLCDLAGLLSIGLLFPELGLHQQSSFAARELKAELVEQTEPDGVDYEHSTAYHRFVLEIFEYAFTLLGEPRPDRLKRMHAFASASLHPDGSLVQIGDNDSGRLLPPFSVHIDPARHTSIFPHTGFYSMHGRNAHVFISAARVGMRGLGSHSHNDLLSFEYFFGRAWIVDPGTFVYLPNIDARNWFRSTGAHNTVRVDREEIRPFHRESIFQMVDRADIQVKRWESSATTDVLEAEHAGYEKLVKPVIHRRLFEFTKATAQLAMLDTFRGKGAHHLEWFFQVHPDVDVQRVGDDFILSSGGVQVRVHIECRDSEMMTIPGWYSPEYGVRLPATTIVARTTVSLPFSARILIEPC